ncbi:unnamed protein product [Pleuronectes platessa]|uniref:Uncharacterized protein n=1 Tax=Pleuronectes platessa TaxID=8262 RepID=A0A9N7VI98_PLEPL|nr:unnamed protein product [Pleuronectes platessa]
MNRAIVRINGPAQAVSSNGPLMWEIKKERVCQYLPIRPTTIIYFLSSFFSGSPPVLCFSSLPLNPENRA